MLFVNCIMLNCILGLSLKTALLGIPFVLLPYGSLLGIPFVLLPNGSLFGVPKKIGWAISRLEPRAWLWAEALI